IIFSKDRDAFNNVDKYLNNKIAFLKEWWQASLLGVLINVITSICTPQARQLLK
ncbi:hypothetical protein BU23DRAFT_494099, partial [Bimuria novae-zelandiae CBS 107.79]